MRPASEVSAAADRLIWDMSAAVPFVVPPAVMWRPLTSGQPERRDARI